MPPRDPKTPSKAGYHHGDLRAALLKAAVELIAEVGLPKLSLRECARRAGVSHAAPYRHFADKDALVVAIALQGFEWLYERGKAAMEDITEPFERLQAYGVAYLRFALEHPVHYRAMFAMDPIECSQAEQKICSHPFELLVEVAQRCYPNQDNPQLAAVSSWSQSHGLAMLILDGRIGRDIIDSPQDAETLARQIYKLTHQSE